MNGLIGTFGYYIPSRTAENYPQLTSLYGLRGETNQKKIASLFKTPTNWTDYCALEISNCEEGDEVAQRPPDGEEEKVATSRKTITLVTSVMSLAITVTSIRIALAM